MNLPRHITGSRAALVMACGLAGVPAPVVSQDLASAPLIGRMVDGGVLAPGPATLGHTLELAGGQALDVTVMGGGDFDPKLTVYDSTGAIMAEDDDSAGNLNPVVTLFSPENQRVRLEIGHSGGMGASGGPVRLLLVNTDFRPNAARPVTSGAEQQGQISSANAQVFTLDGQAGQVWEFILVADGSSLDPYLELLGPDGQTVLATDDDSGGGLNSRLRYTMSDAGTYHVRATGLGRQNAAYQFVARDVTRGDAASLELIVPGAPITGQLDPLDPVRSYRLDPAFVATLPAGPAGFELRVTSSDGTWTPAIGAGFDTPLGRSMAVTGVQDGETGVIRLVLPFADAAAMRPWLDALAVEVSSVDSAAGNYTLELVPTGAGVPPQ